MKKVTVKDKEFRLFIPHEKIKEAIKQVANQINRDLEGLNPLFIVVLNGAFMFAADLFKEIEVSCEVSFVKLSSYSGTQSTNTVRELIGLDENVNGRNVILLEDIIDSGLTIAYTVQKLKNLGAADVKIATLLFKPDAFKKDYHIDYVGMEISNKFIIGYGLDYDEHGRNFPDIYQIVEK